MDVIIQHKRVRGRDLPGCTNPKCRARERHLHKLYDTAHYRAWRCHECGEYVVEGNALKFMDDETKKLQEELKKQTRFRITEHLAQSGLIDPGSSENLIVVPRGLGS